MEVGIGHFVYDFICNRDISVIVSVATRNSEKKGGNIALIVLFGLAALVGFTGFGSFSDLAIWAGWCLINAILAVVAMIKSK